MRIQARQALGRHLGCGQIKHQRPVAQADDARKVGQCRVHLVQGGHQSGATLLSGLHQGVDRLLGPRRVERREWLVDQPQRCRRQQGARQTHPLPLTARQPINPVKQLVAQIKLLQRGKCRRDVGRVQQRAQAGPQAHAGQRAGQHRSHHALARRQRRCLRRQKQPAAQPLQSAPGQLPRRCAVQRHLAGKRRQRAGQHLQQGGLAGARRADHRHLLTGGHAQVQRLDSGCGARPGGGVAGGHITQFDLQSRAWGLSPGSMNQRISGSAHP